MSSKLQVLITSFLPRPAFRATLTPSGTLDSSLTACASGLMQNFTPCALAMRAHRQSKSRRCRFPLFAKTHSPHFCHSRLGGLVINPSLHHPGAGGFVASRPRQLRLKCGFDKEDD